MLEPAAAKESARDQKRVSPGEALRHIHARLIATYNKLMNSRVGYAVVGRALPAALFVLILGAKATWLREFLAVGVSSRAGLDAVAYFAIAFYHSLVLLFLATVCLLFVVRRPVVRGLARFRGAGVAVAGTFMNTPLAFAPLTLPQVELVLAAVVLMTCGIGLSLVALVTLGRCFGISPQARGLVTNGPYRMIRHPLYASEAISTLGMLLPVLSPATFGVFLLHCALQASRALSEEAVLASAFPEYQSYANRVARFIPSVY